MSSPTPPLLTLLPGGWVLPRYSSLVLPDCQQPLTVASVTASKENCIRPISLKFLFLEYLQALGSCPITFLLARGNIWVRIGAGIKCLSPNRAEYSPPCVSFSDSSIASLSDTRQLRAPYRQVLSIFHSPMLMPLNNSVCSRKTCEFWPRLHGSIQEKLQKLSPFGAILHCVLATSTPQRGIFFITI